MNGRHVLILILALLGFAGARHALAQTDAFERSMCQDEFTKLRTELDKRGLALKSAGEKKAGAADICRLLRSYTGQEAQVLKFLQQRQEICGIPEQVIGQAKEGHTKAVQMRDHVCKVAAGPQAPPPPPPSQGLSGALGTSALGGPPSDAGGGSGMFDTLTGNVLKR